MARLVEPSAASAPDIECSNARADHSAHLTLALTVEVTLTQMRDGTSGVLTGRVAVQALAFDRCQGCLSAPDIAWRWVGKLQDFTFADSRRCGSETQVVAALVLVPP
eukprot:3892332-Rhodomonas_salina.1